MQKGKKSATIDIDKKIIDELCEINYKRKNYFSENFCLIMDTSGYNDIFPKHQTYKILKHVMIYVKDGYAKYTINLQERIFNAGDFVIVPRESLIDTLKLSADFRFMGIMFTSTEIERLRLINFKTECIHVAGQEQQIIESYFNMFEELVSLPQFSTDAVEHLIVSLLYNVNRIIVVADKATESEYNNRASKIQESFFNLLGTLGSTKQSIEFYSEKLHISANYLSQIIKKTTEKTVLEWINIRLLAEAEILLRQKDLPIGKIAERLGFYDTAQFSNFFKKGTDMTPNTYRQELIKKRNVLYKKHSLRKLKNEDSL